MMVHWWLCLWSGCMVEVPYPMKEGRGMYL